MTEIKEPKCLGGLGDGIWGTQHRQQDRVYSSDGLAMCHPANIPGGSYKYLVKERKNDIVVIGKMDNTLDNTFESANRVYDPSGICPTIPTCAGGNIQPKVIERAIVDDTYHSRPPRVYEETSPTLRARGGSE